MKHILTTLFLLVLATTLGAQAQPTASLDLGMDAAVPGEDAELIVILSTTGEPAINILRFEVTLPPLVSFVKVSERSGVLATGAEVKAEVLKKDAAAGTTLAVNITSPKPLADGMLVSVDVDVSKDAKIGTEIAIKAGTVTARSADGRPVPAQATDGVISVLSALDQPAAPCFFYMH